MKKKNFFFQGVFSIFRKAILHASIFLSSPKVDFTCLSNSCAKFRVPSNFGSHCFFFKLIRHRTIYQCLQIGYSVIFVKVGRIAARLLSKLVWENYISMVNFQPFLVNFSFRLAQNLIFFSK